jgi:hypothetical protein
LVGGGGGAVRKGDGHGPRRAGDRMGRFGHGGLGAAFSRAAAADMHD